MKILRLKGVIDRITAGVAAIVPNNGGREVYVRASDVPDAREGDAVDLVIIPDSDPNTICQVISKKKNLLKKAPKLISFDSLLRAMEKTLFKLRSYLKEIENAETVDSKSVDEIQEKINYLEKGLALFRRR